MVFSTALAGGLLWRDIAQLTAAAGTGQEGGELGDVALIAELSAAVADGSAGYAGDGAVGDAVGDLFGGAAGVAEVMQLPELVDVWYALLLLQLARAASFAVWFYLIPNELRGGGEEAGGGAS